MMMEMTYFEVCTSFLISDSEDPAKFNSNVPDRQYSQLLRCQASTGANVRVRVSYSSSSHIMMHGIEIG